MRERALFRTRIQILASKSSLTVVACSAEDPEGTLCLKEDAAETTAALVGKSVWVHAFIPVDKAFLRVYSLKKDVAPGSPGKPPSVIAWCQRHEHTHMLLKCRCGYTMNTVKIQYAKCLITVYKVLTYCILTLLVLAGFAMWLPGKVTKIDIDATGTGSVNLTIGRLGWGNQKGLPFKLGTKAKPWDMDEKATFWASLPSEDGGLWLQDFGAPSLWAADTVAAFDELKAKEQHKLEWYESPTHFCILLDNDRGTVGGHRTYMEKQYLASTSFEVRRSARLKKNQDKILSRSMDAAPTDKRTSADDVQESSGVDDDGDGSATATCQGAGPGESESIQLVGILY